jgi:hypothetical protein
MTAPHTNPVPIPPFRKGQSIFKRYKVLKKRFCSLEATCNSLSSSGMDPNLNPHLYLQSLLIHYAELSSRSPKLLSILTNTLLEWISEPLRNGWFFHITKQNKMFCVHESSGEILSWHPEEKEIVKLIEFVNSLTSKDDILAYYYYQARHMETSQNKQVFLKYLKKFIAQLGIII